MLIHTSLPRLTVHTAGSQWCEYRCKKGKLVVNVCNNGRCKKYYVLARKPSCWRKMDTSVSRFVLVLISPLVVSVTETPFLYSLAGTYLVAACTIPLCHAYVRTYARYIIMNLVLVFELDFHSNNHGECPWQRRYYTYRWYINQVLLSSSVLPI